MSVLAVADFIKLQLFIQWPALHFPKRAAVKSKNRLASHLGERASCSYVVVAVAFTVRLLHVTLRPQGATPGCDPRVCCLQAARAYDAAAIVIRGPTARTNFTYPLQLLHLKSKRGKVSTTWLYDSQSSRSWQRHRVKRHATNPLPPAPFPPLRLPRPKYDIACHFPFMFLYHLCHG